LEISNLSFKNEIFPTSVFLFGIIIFMACLEIVLREENYCFRIGVSFRFGGAVQCLQEGIAHA
jgi:hypothetical protein